MVDNLIISKPLQALSSSKRIKPVGYRQNNNHQKEFKETFKDRQKKKKAKEDSMHVKFSKRGAEAGRENQSRPAVPRIKSKILLNKKIIDIRV